MKVTFDGFGLNDAEDEFKSRVATFAKPAELPRNYGEQMATRINSNPDVVAALMAALPALRGEHYPHGYDREAVLSQAVSALLKAGVTLTEIIREATGEVPE